MAAITKQGLNEMLCEAICEVKEAGIEPYHRILPNVRIYPATSYFGYCRYKKDIDAYEITISEYHLNNPIQAVYETLVHEVLHTTQNTRGHCNKWKHYANIMNKKYGYNISRCGTYENGNRLPKIKNYIVECQGCGKQYNRAKKSKLITQVEQYRCGICRDKLIRIK